MKTRTGRKSLHDNDHGKLVARIGSLLPHQSADVLAALLVLLKQPEQMAGPNARRKRS